MTHQYGESCLQGGDARCVTCQLTGRGVPAAPSPPPSEKEERNEVEAVIRALQARLQRAWHPQERHLLADSIFTMSQGHPSTPLTTAQRILLAAEGIEEDWEPRAEWLCQRDEQDELDAAEEVAPTLHRRGLSRLGS